MPKLYVLVGVPGSGKSTWANNQEWAIDCVVISTDQYVEAYARSVNKTYSEVFEEIMPKAVDLMAADVIAARDANKDIIWDQTSTTVASRRKKFVMLPSYHKIAVVFQTPESKELDRRLKSRPGKVIPKTVIENMINNFEEPSEEEGFNEIWYAT
jgi:predicted kinase